MHRKIMCVCVCALSSGSNKKSYTGCGRLLSIEDILFQIHAHHICVCDDGECVGLMVKTRSLDYEDGGETLGLYVHGITHYTL